MSKEVGSIMGGRLENLRQRALYIDLVDGKLQTPTHIRRSETVSLLRDLRVCLVALKEIPNSTKFSDEGISAVNASPRCTTLSGNRH